MTMTELLDAMRRSALVVLFWTGLSALIPLSSSAAGRVTVVWDASLGTNAIAGYKVYYGSASRAYTNVVSAGTATTLSISNLVGGKTYYFAATATDAFGLESDYSGEAAALIPVILPNQPPTLDPIVNLTLDENATFQTVNLSGITSGATNEVQTLALTAASSNPALIPTPAVNYTSPGTTGSLTFTPALFGYGSSTLTVTVNDGCASNNTISRAFTVTVKPVNMAPTLNPIADLTINENAGLQTVSLAGIGSGAPNETQTLTITTASSNPALIPPPAVTYTSPNTTGSISFTPVAKTFGSATLTVTVNDGGASNNVVSRTFTVTVNQVNQAPTLDPLANVTINENAGQQIVHLSGISVGESLLPQTLTVTASSSNPSLIPTPVVSYQSPGATGSIAFAPVTNTYGSASITVTVNDGGSVNNLFSHSFTVTVSQVAKPPGCAYTLVMSPTNFSPNAASGTFSVSTTTSCAWSLAGPPWLLLSVTNGTGSAAGTFTVDPNTGPARSGLTTLLGDATNVSCTITQQAVPAGAVALATPLDAAVSQSPRPQFSWSPSDPAATRYYLLITCNGGKYLETWVDGTTNWSASSDLPGGSYTWAVQSYETNTAGAWSTNSAFTVPATAPNNTLALFSPIGMANISGALRFSWRPDPAASRYELHIEKDGSLFFDQTFSLTDSLVNASSGEFAVALSQVGSGTYLWWVRGWSPAGYGPWSDRARAIVSRTP